MENLQDLFRIACVEVLTLISRREKGRHGSTGLVNVLLAWKEEKIQKCLLDKQTGKAK